MQMSSEELTLQSPLHDKDFAPGTRVLIAEDDPITRMMLGATLSSWGVETIQVGDGDEALKVMQSEDPPRLALLDWIMPGKDGPQVCKELRTGAPEPYIYTILLTSMDRKEDLITGLESGADDYLIKPYDPSELRVRLKAGERIVRLQAELISAREALRIQATRDSLTGLLNRRAMHDSFEEQLSRARRKSEFVSVLLVDIDHFKRINDTYGHDAGDTVLVEVSQRMNNSIRKYDILSRHGGEEFLLLFPECNVEQGQAIAQKLREVVRGKSVSLDNGTTLQVTASMGLLTLVPGEEHTQSQLVNAADEALYEAKQTGRDRVVHRTSV